MVSINFYTKKNDLGPNHSQFVIEPLEPSFGQSMGNALRRTLLSSMRGAAITSVKIDGAPHFFSTLKGVKESVLDLIMNMKQLRFEVPGEGKYKISLSKKGAGRITGKDIEGELTVINKDLYIGEITDDKGKISIEALVQTGRGYVSGDEQEVKEYGFTNIDSSFSPVQKVNFQVEEARVGRKTNFDRLIINITTNGSITPEQALHDSAVILTGQFQRIVSGEDKPVAETGVEDTEKARQEQIDKKFSDLIIDELNLPSRVVNALLRENIETVADLIKIGKDKLVGLKGLGRKSIDLIEEELKKLGVELK
jgi:DNA-directed RNA polymerase subunit alpha